MDRGAARSRKRTKQLDKPVSRTHERPGPNSRAPATVTTTGNAHPTRDAGPEAGPSRQRQQKAAKGEFRTKSIHARDDEPLFKPTSGFESARPVIARKRRGEEREEQSRDPALYRPKAIRESTALVYSSSPFTLPPDLSHVTRLDLEGSGVTDVSWLKGSKVTWLSLKGCQLEKGWDAVGSLDALSGQSVFILNITGD